MTTMLIGSLTLVFLPSYPCEWILLDPCSHDQHTSSGLVNGVIHKAGPTIALRESCSICCNSYIERVRCYTLEPNYVVRAEEFFIT